MGSLAEYFEKNRYHGSWQIGDRVFGRWNKIPFIGSVGNDTLISEEQGPRVTVLLDLPIIYENKLHNIIIVKPKEIKRLTTF